MTKPDISVIAVVGKNGELGKDGQLLWHLPDDMKRFKELTMGHPVIMGRKTWESIPGKFRPLPGRTNIIVTRQKDYNATDAIAVNSFPDARAATARAEGSDETFIIGGAELYEQALPSADRLYLTLVDAETEADVYFPPYEDRFIASEEHEGTGIPPHRFVTFTRK
ncbi:hypothetical protein A2678_00800 [Candidatus Kaiserbacteria bacterium RIFCSPHIGHO2_01_FULL_53_31]|uniref:Dihydrofolate reductase n=1 Tax=Candidatus Kaiserbacteria bacterium RIFCSPHIGHO2_01_FULL_53_31 TaxID=1798481 RepID=A0A1F6CJL7_9BACT|nr:MAG: hypothetical protein A2678_00800 [Candidatus Kaiserbacteria bacterium RIFCSPHIGHO2_01_FULL_53_31]